MSGDAARANECESDEQRGGAKAVEQGIERREECELGARCVRGGVLVDQPEEEERSGRADGEYGDDCRAGARSGTGRGCCGGHTFLSALQRRRA